MSASPFGAIRRSAMAFAVALLCLSLSSPAFAESTEKSPAAPAPATAASGPVEARVWLWINDVFDISFPTKRLSIDGYISIAYPSSAPASIKPLQCLEIMGSRSFAKSQLELRDVNPKNPSIAKDSCRFTAVLKQDWDTRKYPFDRHLVSFSFEDYANVSDAQVYAENPSVNFDPELNIHGWDVSSLGCSRSVHQYIWDDEESYSRLNVSFVLARKSVWVIYVKTFLTMFIAIALSLMAFAIKPSDISARFGLPVASIFAVVGNQNIVNQTMPPNSMFTFVDIMHILSYLFILFCVCASAASLKLCHDGKVDAYKAFDRRLLLILSILYALIVSATTFFVCRGS